MMNDNLFNKLAYRISAKAPDLTAEDIRSYDEEVTRRQRMADLEREMLFRERQERIKRENEARQAPPQAQAESVPDSSSKWVPIITSLEWTILTRSRGQVQHHDFAFFKTGSSDRPEMFVGPDAFTNYLTCTQNLNHRMKR